MSIEVNRADFPGPNGERNFNIVCDWSKYQRCKNKGKGIRGEYMEGSYAWIGNRYGVSQRVCIGVVWRWRQIIAKRTAETCTPQTCRAEPYRPRTNY